MSNSPLVDLVMISPNSTNPRNQKITKITVHHTAGVLTAKQIGNVFAPVARQASCNYGIGSDGKIVMCCEEKNRSWCSSSRENDNKAITIEVSNDGGAPDWHVSDLALNKLVELCVDICKRNGIERLNFTGDKNGNLTMHKYFAATACPGPYLGSKFPWIAEQVNKQLVKSTTTATKGTQATSFANMTDAQVVAKVGPLFTADQRASGVLASVSMAQFLLESAYGKSELAQNANNCFGMKKSLSGNSWAGSKWDGSSVYSKQTKEQHADGTYTTITADFRKYGCVEDSIADHSAYLIGAKNGTTLRYAGLKGETDYRKAAQIIKDGGYATSLTYVDKLCNVIEKWNLTKFDVPTPAQPTVKPTQPHIGPYRIRKSWTEPKTQIGAYSSFENAKKACKPGYYVFSGTGEVLYPEVPSVQPSNVFEVGNEVRLNPGAKYTNGKTIPNWIVKSKLYVREVRPNGDIVFSLLKIGPVTGVTKKESFVGGATDVPAANNSEFKVRIVADSLNIRLGPGTSYSKVGTIRDKGIYTIVAQNGTWGYLKSKVGWISLNYTKKV